MTLASAATILWCNFKAIGMICWHLPSRVIRLAVTHVSCQLRVWYLIMLNVY